MKNRFDPAVRKAIKELLGKIRPYIFSNTPKKKSHKLPFYEKNLFWGSISLSVAFILAVVAIMIRDVRWLLIPAWIIGTVPFYMVIEGLNLKKWLIFPGSLLLGIALLYVSNLLSPVIQNKTTQNNIAQTLVNKPELHPPVESEKPKELKSLPMIQKKKVEIILAKPFFDIEKPPEFQVAPKMQIVICLKNTSNHTATNLFNRQIIVDQEFKIKPDIVDSSEGNDFLPGTSKCFTESVTLQASALLPIYVIHAINYQDKDYPLQYYKQIFSFKTKELWDSNKKRNSAIFIRHNSARNAKTL